MRVGKVEEKSERYVLEAGMEGTLRMKNNLEGERGFHELTGRKRLYWRVKGRAGE